MNDDQNAHEVVRVNDGDSKQDSDLQEIPLSNDANEKENELRKRSHDEDKTSVSNGASKEKDVEISVLSNEPDSEGKCSKLCDKCEQAFKPCLVKYNPLPENPTFVDKFMYGIRLPPHGSLASYLQFAIICLQIWGILVALTQDQGLPGGNLFSLLVLFVACVFGGYVISFVNLPPLLGMLIMGVMLRNIPGVRTIGDSIDSKWSGALRKLALTVILTRAGLGLDIPKLRRLSFAVLRLAFLPCIAEAITVGIASHFLLGFSWTWSLMLGCILGALSPAVTVPSLVNLQDRQYGVAKGIPTMLLAAGGLDNVLCVTGFAVFLGINFADDHSTSTAVTIVKGPAGAILGVIYGFVMGTILWYLPAKDSTNKLFFRSLILIGSGMIAIFGSSAVGLSGAGPLGCLTTATVAAYRWRQQRKPGETDEVSGVMAVAWLIMQHFLFGLIGAAVNISNIKGNTAGLGIATLAIGLSVRSVVSFTVTLGTGFNIKERIFITVTWLAKATVQAAIGGLALDKAIELNDPELIRKGTDVLTIAVLAIVICAPVGATCMAILGPRFLVKGEGETDECNGTKDKEVRVITSANADDKSQTTSKL